MNWTQKFFGLFSLAGVALIGYLHPHFAVGFGCGSICASVFIFLGLRTAIDRTIDAAQCSRNYLAANDAMTARN